MVFWEKNYSLKLVATELVISGTQCILVLEFIDYYYYLNYTTLVPSFGVSVSALWFEYEGFPGRKKFNVKMDLTETIV